jgi:glycosyltransferase involved in cell wall biosynthesis
LKKYTSKEIKEFVSKPLFNEKVILNKDPNYPKISIVTPSYNQVEFLERTILSVLNQNYPNFEYIIIDGGSTDGSVEMIKKYEQYLAYWTSEKDNGQTDAINKGFSQATGEILGWQNSDDIYMPRAFYEAIEKFSRNTDADLVFGNKYWIDEKDRIIRDARYVSFNYYSLLYEGSALSNQSTFWKKTLMDRIGFFNQNFKFCMDYDFWVRASKKGKFLLIRNYLGATRYHKNTKTNTIVHIWHTEYLAILKREGVKPNKFLHLYSLTRRFLLYILQGDLFYVIRGFCERICKRRILGEGWFYKK